MKSVTRSLSVFRTVFRGFFSEVLFHCYLLFVIIVVVITVMVYPFISTIGFLRKFVVFIILILNVSILPAKKSMLNLPIKQSYATARKNIIFVHGFLHKISLKYLRFYFVLFSN